MPDHIKLEGCDNMLFEFVAYAQENVVETLLRGNSNSFACDLPLCILASCLNVAEMDEIAKIHGIWYPVRTPKNKKAEIFKAHASCKECTSHCSVLVASADQRSSKEQNTMAQKNRRAIKKQIEHGKSKKDQEALQRKRKYLHDLRRKFDKVDTKFPPRPPSDRLLHKIISGFCSDSSPASFQEAGCAVCGQLTPLTKLTDLKTAGCDLSPLISVDVTRKERKSLNDPIEECEGPVLDNKCSRVCTPCKDALDNGCMPLNSLANGLWLGEVPLELLDLTFAERILIARVRHNRCLVRVSSGRAKMTANAIMFSSPIVKVYHKLPPSKDELDEVLAFIFIGSAQPTVEEFKRTPMLVRRNKVSDALNWLKLNHIDYADLEISKDNLDSYPLEGVPVIVDYKKREPTEGNKLPTQMSQHDLDDEEGTEDGPCPFTVHGLTGTEYKGMSIKALKARALQHLDSEGRTLGIGHDDKPQSMYDNPQAYPQMFPWLFPYGMGEIGQARHKKKFSEMSHKKHLLMYQDKRFQNDIYFPIIAFNHDQLKGGTTGSFLLAKKKNFNDITNRLLSINSAVLADLAERMEGGEHVKPETDDEKLCFDILDDLDHVGGHVKGSLTSKKHMRNEIWSLISFLGAPSWFITFSPADNSHPICLYFADQDIYFKPELRSSTERNHLIANNPVAAARFFDMMVKLFIKHVLAFDQDTRGLYGETAAYYGTVEQQGRLTLHMHLLLWIRGALSPQLVRERLMDPESKFQQELIKYLESVHVGEFLTGTLDEIRQKVPYQPKEVTGIHSTIKDNQVPSNVDPTYKIPTQTLPIPPPPMCEKKICVGCTRCTHLKSWWVQFKNTVDDLVFRSNLHGCQKQRSEVLKERKKKKPDASDINIPKGCLDKDGICSARFPREIVLESSVDKQDGYIKVKKLESMLNTLTPTLTYVMRCNTDVTSLNSGTSIKAIVSYISDYVTKQSLKTHQIFSNAYDVLEKNPDLMSGDVKRKDAARKLALKIVNSLTTKLEIGSPMASMYLLGNPDHYTSHEFVTFWWRSYVTDVLSTWHAQDAEDDSNNTSELSSSDTDAGTDFVDDDDYFNTDDAGTEIDGDDDNDSQADTNLTTPDSGSFLDLHRTGGGASDEALPSSVRFITPDVKIKQDQDNEDLHSDKVMLNRSKGNYVGISNVDDYKYRPEIYSDMCLYDWIQSYSRQKRSKSQMESFELSKSEFSQEEQKELENEFDIKEEEDVLDDLVTGKKSSLKKKRKSKWHDFLPEHPLHGTHIVKRDISRLDFMVPNFVGGPLPRCDRGDREYYCCTMLTLFKPWRKGTDLKTQIQTWDDIFVAHKFTIRQQALLRNFNLKYECLDARDDYYAEMKRKKKDAKSVNRWMGHEDEYADDVDGVNFGMSEDLTSEDFTELGRKTMSQLKNMDEAEQIMKSAGWMDKSDGPLPDVDLNLYKSTTNMTPGAWKNTVKLHREAILTAKMSNAPSNGGVLSVNMSDNTPNEVKILTPEYFKKNHVADKIESQRIIDDTVYLFKLNEEQERAFRIIANHASSPGSEQLKMYLGGMGGTGKSQVIKSLIHFFNERNESHRFTVVAPTGTAAALLNGSTYHSLLGISSYSDDRDSGRYKCNENTVINEVRAKLRGVEYFFLDEVSMVGCSELHAINARLAQVLDIHDTAFGGMNVIFAGDFAQLPPVAGNSLYSSNIGKVQHARMKVHDQENTMGKILWHQVTTVVILRKNMRQQNQSLEDEKLRKALVNMRYAACTEDDIEFLRSRVAGRAPGRPKLTDRLFRNVSVITGWNSQKDRLNDIGCARFARDTGQKLTSFYSIDSLSSDDNDGNRPKRRGRKPKNARLRKGMTKELQDILWSSSPNTSNHIAGKLSICVGMPIMIRNNDATELCITKGQEATVAGWDSSTGSFGQPVLDTLFLKLVNPPRDIQIADLPVNIVPMSRTATIVRCQLPNDTMISISRQQVVVLPNFSMTDYACQGKTRKFNVVDLGKCKTSLSYYTCLSRSADASGTVIVQGFNPKMITCGIQGFLRQEFRELDLLDEITKLRYNGELPLVVTGRLRNPLVRSYQMWKGADYESPGWHPALKWQLGENHVLPVETDGTWDININAITLTAKARKAAFSNVQNNTLKRGIDLLQNDPEYNKEEEPRPSKRYRLTPVNEQSMPVTPLGLIWDGTNYSCAYDACFTILYSIWVVNAPLWTRRMIAYSNFMKILVTEFDNVRHGRVTFEEARDLTRYYVNLSNPYRFPMGTVGTNSSDLLGIMCGDTPCAHVSLVCPSCNHEQGRRPVITTFKDVFNRSDLTESEDNYTLLGLFNLQQVQNTEISCPQCVELTQTHKLQKIIKVTSVPNMIVAGLNHDDNIIAPYIKIPFGNRLYTLRLRGIVYGGQFHFTSKIINLDGTIWYHDGQVTGSTCRQEGSLNHLASYDSLRTSGMDPYKKKAVALIYSRR